MTWPTLWYAVVCIPGSFVLQIASLLGWRDREQGAVCVPACCSGCCRLVSCMALVTSQITGLGLPQQLC